MKIEMRPLAEIRPYDRNPRLNDQAVDAVVRSILEFGWRQPIVVDAEGVIVAGHTRYKAATKLGLEKVPVHVARDLTPAQVQAYRLADNRTSDLASWDYDLLPLELADLQGQGADLSGLGWDEAEIQRLLAGKDGTPPPPEAQGREFDEGVAAEVDTATCPKCGFVFPA
jgi:ParB-like chromosome segregation protein Spo0J